MNDLPATRTVDVVDDYFGTPVADPYRWLESSADPEVAEWLAAQAAVTRDHLAGLPDPSPIRALLDLAVRRPRSDLPRHHGRYWFRTHNDGVQQQDVLVVEDAPFDGTARVLIDPNELGDDSVSIAAFQPSPDGALVAYSYSEAGSDWRTWRVRETSTGMDRPTRSAGRSSPGRGGCRTARASSTAHTTRRRATCWSPVTAPCG